MYAFSVFIAEWSSLCAQSSNYIEKIWSLRRSGDAEESSGVCWANNVLIHNLWYARLGNVDSSSWAGASAEADNRVYANGKTFLASGRANIAVFVGRSIAVDWILDLHELWFKVARCNILRRLSFRKRSENKSRRRPLSHVAASFIRQSTWHLNFGWSSQLLFSSSSLTCRWGKVPVSWTADDCERDIGGDERFPTPLLKSVYTFSPGIIGNWRLHSVPMPCRLLLPDARDWTRRVSGGNLSQQHEGRLCGRLPCVPRRLPVRDGICHARRECVVNSALVDRREGNPADLKLV